MHIMIFIISETLSETSHSKLQGMVSTGTDTVTGCLLLQI